MCERSMQPAVERVEEQGPRGVRQGPSAARYVASWGSCDDAAGRSDTKARGDFIRLRPPEPRCHVEVARGASSDSRGAFALSFGGDGWRRGQRGRRKSGSVIGANSISGL